jgi:hypothetical protein
LDRLLERSFTGLGTNLLDRYRTYRAHLFVFLHRADVPADNNACARARRPSVIHRKVMGSFRSEWGAQAYAALSVGTDSHRRLQRGLERACLAQEVFFEVSEYRLHGFCDGVLYIPPDKAADESSAGFWALEFKTAAASEFDKVKAAGIPKEEHIRQAQIYLFISTFVHLR